MGTNYYAVDVRFRRSISDPGGTSYHIGKSSCGWTFTFHGTETIRCYSDWLAILKQPDVLIFNEYGECIPLTDFKALVESERSEPNNNALLFLGDQNWVDEDGNSFSGGDFC